MAGKLKSPLGQLKGVIYKFDSESAGEKLKILTKISSCEFSKNDELVSYYHLLLFLCAYPSDVQLLKTTEKELARISRFMHSLSIDDKRRYENSGLPYASYLSCFTHDFLQWLTFLPGLRISLSSIENTKLDLNDVLKHTLPALEKSETTAGCTNEQLFEALNVPAKKQFHFLLNELSKLDHLPFIKDHFYEGLGVYTEIIPSRRSFSLAYNRIEIDEPYINTSPNRKFDHLELLNTPVKKEKKLSQLNRNKLISVLKLSMAITDRETDTVSFMDENSLKYFSLDQGISIAVYTMTTNRQLPLESYVGFTLFKNGFPVAYGGAWVFGNRANFGINIFEQFRGGESGYVLCQVIRLYRHVFNINYFVIEPYQFGYDNPEGIESGAFWFYFKYGFRPVDKKLLKLANSEALKKQKKSNYRTPKNKLIQFTESDMALNLDGDIQLSVVEIMMKVKTMISQIYKGDRADAVNKCVSNFLRLTRTKMPLDPCHIKVMQDLALWTTAFNIRDPNKLRIMKTLISSKCNDVYRYQNHLLKYFNS